ncbi:MAG TPA: hypothetical protein IAB55_00160 [Candidatus Merdivicinus faecavium]|nr:hypothetical protein [Candidatus Merdivicinus faecavium]
MRIPALPKFWSRILAVLAVLLAASLLVNAYSFYALSEARSEPRQFLKFRDLSLGGTARTEAILLEQYDLLDEEAAPFRRSERAVEDYFADEMNVMICGVNEDLGEDRFLMELYFDYPTAIPSSIRTEDGFELPFYLDEDNLYWIVDFSTLYERIGLDTTVTVYVEATGEWNRNLFAFPLQFHYYDVD